MPTLLESQRALRDRLFAAAASESLEPRAAIYRNTCIETLLRALRLSFPALQYLVGEAYFHAASHRYVHEQPPTGGCLNDYGAGFSQFLSQLEISTELPYLHEVAQLEWAVNSAFHADDRAPLDLRRLEHLDAPALSCVCLVPHPALTLLSLRYPVDRMWAAAIARDDRALAAVDLADQDIGVLVERDVQGVQVRRLHREAWEFTRRLTDGASLQSVAQDLEEDAAARLQALLADHLARGRFIDCLAVCKSAETAPFVA